MARQISRCLCHRTRRMDETKRRQSATNVAIPRRLFIAQAPPSHGHLGTIARQLSHCRARRLVWVWLAKSALYARQHRCLAQSSKRNIETPHRSGYRPMPKPRHCPIVYIRSQCRRYCPDSFDRRCIPRIDTPISTHRRARSLCPLLQRRFTSPRHRQKVVRRCKNTTKRVLHSKP